MTGGSDVASRHGRPPGAPFAAGRFFEDFLEGETFALGTATFSRDEVVAFAADFDPQPFHLDEAAARRSLLGRLAASGWQSTTLLNRFLGERLLAGSAARRILDVPEVRWRRPVLPDVPLSIAARVGRCAADGAPEGAGIATLTLEARAPDGALVTMADFRVLVDRWGGGSSRGTVGAGPPARAAADAGGPPRIDPPPPDGIWYEDPEPGVELAIGSHVFSAEEVEAFRARHDPDDLAVPAPGAIVGWHLGGLWMRRWVAYLGLDSGGGGDGPAGPAIGVSDVAWPHPAWPGVRVDFHTRLAERRPSASRPGWGLHVRENGARLADGTEVLRFRSSVFVRRREADAGGAAGAAQ